MLDVKRIKALRERQGLTQTEAAARAGLPGRQTWCDVEKGRRMKIHLDTLERIAKALGVRAKDLLT